MAASCPPPAPARFGAFLGILAWLFLGAPPTSSAANSSSARPARAAESKKVSSGPAAGATADAMRLVHGNCFSCHNPAKHKGGLDLSTRDATLVGGNSGKAVLPGDPSKSLLLSVLAAEGDPHMPPKKQLAPAQIEVVRRWIETGAHWDAELLATLSAPRVVRPGPLTSGYGPVTALALNPDGTRLAIGRGREIAVHDLAATNQPVLRRWIAHRDQVRALAWSPDNHLLASGGYRELTAWNVTNFTAAWEFSAPLVGRVGALRFTPHGGALVVADGAPAESGWIRVLAGDTGASLADWQAHADTIQDLALSADGGTLATAGADRLVKVWELVSRKEIARLEGHVGVVSGVAFGASAAELLSVGLDKQLKLWDVKTRESVVTIGGRRSALNGAAWSANAARVAVIDDDGRLHAFTEFKKHSGEQSSATASERELGHWPSTLHVVAISADGNALYAGGEDGIVHGVDKDGKTLGTFAPLPPLEASPPATPEPAPASGATEALAGIPATNPTAPAKAPARPARDPGFDRFRFPEPGPGRAFTDETLAFAPRSPRAAKTAPVTSSTSDAVGEATAPVPSFTFDILPMLAKAGCAAGACHAKADGQNGFKLSVFSYDPKADHAEIATEARGRRIFPAAPEESLLLLKATAAIEHGGGRRIDPGSAEYQWVLRWIRGGMPYQRTNEPTLARLSVEPRESTYERKVGRQLRVQAHYSDGSTRDVTHLAEYSSSEKEIVQVDDHGTLRVGTLAGEGVIVARFMGLVDASRVTVPAEHILPAERYAALPENNFIDGLAWAQFRKLGLFPSEPCTDAEFFRRAHLDIIGVLPSPEATRAFLAGATNSAGTDPRRHRAEAVDRMLARPEFADYWANKWADLLRPNPDRVGVKSIYVLDQWLRESFRTNTPMDRFARELLLAEGSNHREGPTVVYRDRREPPELTTMFSQLFLGVRMECAKCHHHPNEKWSQEDFYRFAAYFGPLKQKGAGLSPPISAGNESFFYGAGGSVRHPITEAVMTPRPPDGPELPAGYQGDPRRPLADWLTRPDNPFFARAMVNRVWAVLFGRGFVEPVDDFRVSNPASNEPLLAALAADFVAHGYDLKHLLRTIVDSRLYQLGSTPNEYNLADTRNYSRSYRRRLPAEVMLDAVNDITGLDDEFNGCPPGTRAMQAWSYKVRSQFLDAFGRPNSSSDCPCERDLRTSVVQALHLMNSIPLHNKLSHAAGRVKKLADGPLPPAGIVDELYLAALGRFPSPAELGTASAIFNGDKVTRQTATEDVLWALLNSPEFVFNH